MLRAMASRLADTANRVEPSVVVVGAGISGLAVAHAIHRARPGVSVTVLESSERPGGNIRTEVVDGFVIDAGPDSFLKTKPGGLDLCRELGLERDLVATREAARRVFVAHRGRLVLLPGGMALAVPTRLGPLFETPLLGFGGKVRMLAEPIVPRPKSRKDESIDAFFTRRLGREGAERLAAPLLGGIYAGDTRELSIVATFPELVLIEEKYGSLLRGLLAKERALDGKEERAPTFGDLAAWLRRSPSRAAPSPFSSFPKGMGTLVDALVRSLPPGSVKTRTHVTAIERVLPRGWTVRAGAEEYAADALVLAVPAHVAARLAPTPALRDELGAIPHLSTATVFFALEENRVSHPLDGLGFIVPEGESKLLAATWVSSKWQDRAPIGSALVRGFVGGARDAERVHASTDEELVAFARTELERFMGPLGPARFTRVYRYENANPQPVVGHGARFERISGLVDEIPDLHLAGAGYEGVGVPDCVRRARAVAGKVLVELARRTEGLRAEG